ncbi:MAG: hypothetical protein WB511_10265 [Nitrososphaeraceae archaeon]
MRLHLQSGFHRLYINDKNQHHKLIVRIDNLSRAVAEVTGITDDPNFKKVTLPTLKSPSPIEYYDIMHLCQVTVFQTIDAIYRDIRKLRNENDRQTLYLRLIDGLAESNGFSLLLNAIAYEKLQNKMNQLDYNSYNSKDGKTIQRLLDVLRSIR